MVCWSLSGQNTCCRRDWFPFDWEDHFRTSLLNKIKVRYASTKPSRILVFESRTGAALVDTVLRDLDFRILDCRFRRYTNQVCLLNGAVICAMLKYRFSKKVGWIDAYLMAWIAVSKAEVVLDRSHNLNLALYARYFPETHFFLIQNGSWLISLNPKIESPRFIQMLSKKASTLTLNLHVCCFGQNDIEKIAGTSDEIKFHPMPIGSLMGDHYFFAKCGQKSPPAKYRICLCSQAVPARIAKGGALGERRLRAYELLDQFLVRFCDEHQVSAVIAPRKKPGDEDWQEERNFHLATIGSSTMVQVAEQQGRDATYELMNESEVVLSLYSTTGFEAIKWGKKVMFCPFYHDDVFKASSPRFVKDSDCWPWWLAEPDYDAFNSMLKRLLDAPDVAYLEKTREAASYLSGYGMPTGAHEALHDAVNGILKKQR